jgi:hypothetical protein
MFAIVLSILLLAAILSFYSHIMMRIRLTKAEPSRDKLVWWRRGSGEVTSMYEELFPCSYMPLISQFAFWLVFALAFVIVAAVLWKSH